MNGNQFPRNNSSFWVAILLVLLSAGSMDAQHREETDVSILELPSKSNIPDAPPADVERVAKLLIEQTNAFRKAKELDPLKPNAELADTGRYFADYMARTRRYGHLADGQRPAERADNHGYDYCIVLENIAYAYQSRGYEIQPLAEKFFQGWKTSEGHRENMLNPYVTETGLVVVYSKDSGYYFAVQMLGRPKSEQIEVRFVNETDEEVDYKLSVEGKADATRSFPLPTGLIRSHSRCRPSRFQFSFMEDWESIESGTTYRVTQTEGKLQVVAAEPSTEEEADSDAPQ